MWKITFKGIILFLLQFLIFNNLIFFNRFEANILTLSMLILPFSFDGFKTLLFVFPLGILNDILMPGTHPDTFALLIPAFLRKPILNTFILPGKYMGYEIPSYHLIGHWRFFLLLTTFQFIYVFFQYLVTFSHLQFFFKTALYFITQVIINTVCSAGVAFLFFPKSR